MNEWMSMTYMCQNDNKKTLTLNCCTIGGQGAASLKSVIKF